MGMVRVASMVTKWSSNGLAQSLCNPSPIPSCASYAPTMKHNDSINLVKQSLFSLYFRIQNINHLYIVLLLVKEKQPEQTFHSA